MKTNEAIIQGKVREVRIFGDNDEYIRLKVQISKDTCLYAKAFSPDAVKMAQEVKEGDTALITGRGNLLDFPKDLYQVVIEDIQKKPTVHYMKNKWELVGELVEEGNSLYQSRGADNCFLSLKVVETWGSEKIYPLAMLNRPEAKEYLKNFEPGQYVRASGRAGYYRDHQNKYRPGLILNKIENASVE